MPQIIPCPECANRIRVTDDLLGKRVRCPRCGKPFDAVPIEGASPVMAVADPSLDPPALRSPQRDLPRAEQAEAPSATGETSAWENVLTGVNLQTAAHVLAILGGLMVIGSLVLMAASLDDRSANGSTLFARLMGAAATIGLTLVAANWIVSLGANSFALAAPLSRGSRPLAVLGLALSVVVLVTMFPYHQLTVLHAQPGSDTSGFDVISGPRFTGRLPGIENLRVAVGLVAVLSVVSLASLIDLARLAVVPLFVRSVGRNLRDRTTADSGQTAVWVTAIVFCAAVGLELLMRIRNRTSGDSQVDERFVLYVLALGLAAARLLILLAGLFALRRAKAALNRHLSAAVRAEVP
jgi:predicted Zn finger-like uncharacterized protein